MLVLTEEKEWLQKKKEWKRKEIEKEKEKLLLYWDLLSKDILYPM